MKKPLLVLTVAIAASPALDAKTYSCGEGCYTDNSKASKGQAKLGQQIGYYTSVKPQKPAAEVAKAETTPAAKPVVAAPKAVQVARRSTPLTQVASAAPQRPTANTTAKASGRRSILEQELNNERNALAQAQKALADGRVVLGTAADANHQNKVRQLESAVLDRQQNIQALQRELSRM
ncbi:hypothetical protein [Alysiella filiformis]|uniref:Periplasmic protein n=1 Tax=Alysiella filiformis DSM 16848 TaxID=1120981 RepID=A0A286ECE5_9NEIS|nr:hypothetical protein [Alysiella filiformis]QMT30567.1 hypothetical protein H3L97_07345 [Alysiella filiformis]UBQ56453.1 hypothetical protein JF568_01335 [Alysiella filiformis DSM 16848]SOD68591.1 hypothetical protein SAMN02746062_01327 [Alysiella filiformis DSM 16848]